MAKYLFTRPGGPWQYPTLGFTAVAGDVIEADAAIDAWWELTSPDATVTIPVIPEGGVPPEPVDGSLMVYDRQTNTVRFEPTLPDDKLPERLSEAALNDAIAQGATPTANGLAFRAALNSKLPCVWVHQGDSTANAPDEWLRLLVDDIPAAYPHLRVTHALWSQTRLAYDSPDIIAAGVEAYHEPSATNMVHLNNTGALSTITGDMELHVKVRSTDIDAATRRILLAKWGSSAAEQSFWWYIDGTNGLTLGWQETGGAFRSAAVASLAQLTAQFADNADVFIGVRLDADNGSGQYTVTALRSTTGLTGSWVAFGTPITGTTGVTSVKTTTGYLKIGGRGNTAGNTDPFNGRIYWAEACAGIAAAAAIRARFDPNLATRLSSWTGVDGYPWVKTAAGTTLGSPTLLVLNASSPGEDASYSVTHFAAQAPFEPTLGTLSYSYNGPSASQQADYAGVVYAPLLDLWQSTYPRALVIPIMQGPNVAPRTTEQIADQARRVRGVGQLAASRGKQIVDVFTALSEDTAAYIDPADGVHPLPAGSARWKEEVRRALWPAIPLPV